MPAPSAALPVLFCVSSQAAVFSEKQMKQQLKPRPSYSTSPFFIKRGHILTTSDLAWWFSQRVAVGVLSGPTLGSIPCTPRGSFNGEHSVERLNLRADNLNTSFSHHFGMSSL